MEICARYVITACSESDYSTTREIVAKNGWGIYFAVLPAEEKHAPR